MGEPALPRANALYFCAQNHKTFRVPLHMSKNPTCVSNSSLNSGRSLSLRPTAAHGATSPRRPSGVTECARAFARVNACTALPRPIQLVVDTAMVRAGRAGGFRSKRETNQQLGEGTRRAFGAGHRWTESTPNVLKHAKTEIDFKRLAPGTLLCVDAGSCCSFDMARRGDESSSSP